MIPAQLGSIHGHRVVDTDIASCLGELVECDNGWRLAHVVSLGFERQSPQGDGLVLEIVAKVLLEFLEQNLLLHDIDVVDGLQHLHRAAIALTDFDQVLDVLREQRSAIATAREDVLGPNAAVGAHAMSHRVDVGAHTLAQIGNLVHEADTCGKH